MLRNHPVESTWALGLIAAALALALVATLASSWDPAIKGFAHVFIGLSAVLFLVGLSLTGDLVVKTDQDHSQPSISADLKIEGGAATLEAVIKGSGVRASEHVTIEVFPSSSSTGYPPIYQSDGGGDSDGNFETKLSLPVPRNGPPNLLITAFVSGTKRPECNKDLPLPANGTPTVTLGCLQLTLPAPDSRPQLTVSADADPKSGVLVVKVNQLGVPVGQSLSLEVSGKSGGMASVAIYRALVQADASGKVADEVRVAVPAGYTNVCVAAKSGATWEDADCPPDADNQTAWVLFGDSSPPPP
jgi:hypothetical protein